MGRWAPAGDYLHAWEAVPGAGLRTAARSL